MKLTMPMKEQLLNCLDDIKESGVYCGNREQFWKRHEKIVEWVREQGDSRE